MSSSPRLDALELALIVLEAGLYGIFLVLLQSAVITLLERRKRGHPYILLLSVSVSLFCTITVHLALDISRAFDAFIYLQDKSGVSNEPASVHGLSPATQYFLDLSSMKYLVISILYVITTTIGDGFMIYRLYIVWNRNIWITVIPMICQLAMCATGGYIQYLAHNKSGDSIFKTVGGWITAWYALTLGTNLIASVLIAYKVWLSKRNVSKLGNRLAFTPLQRVINAMIQSAALYSLCLLLSLILYARHNNVQFVLAATNCPVVGIAFTMIAARSGQGSAGSESQNESHSLQDLRPMTIKITREINSDTSVQPFPDTKGRERSFHTSEELLDSEDASHKGVSFVGEAV